MMQVTKVWWDGERLMAEPIDPAAIYKDGEQPEQAQSVTGCLRCNTPKKCALYGCSPNTWPSEATPHRQPWVGLTDDEVAHIADSEWEEAFVRLIEAKLKEKNNAT